jgi:hypothetical protein
MTVSPIMQDVPIRYSTVTFNGTFEARTPYTEDPSPKVDAAWAELGTASRHFRVPEDQATRYGLDPGYARWSKADGGGYPVLFEFTHHLHCIDLIRQALVWNYDYYLARGSGAFINDPDVIKTHTYHCIDTLRQVIMCKPDLGVYGQYWIKSTNGTFVDFFTEHKCKNFDQIRDWVVDHQVSADFLAMARMEAREDDVVLDSVH